MNDHDDARRRLADLAPLVERALQLLESTPRGASRRDIVSALNVHNALWPTLRRALEATGLVVTVGRGPGLKHVHRAHAVEVPDRAAPRDDGLSEARAALLALLHGKPVIDSRDAQAATGLNADAARRLLNELVQADLVARTGTKRGTRYRWRR